MSKDKKRLDRLIEGYLDYLATVGRRNPRTIVDVRCTFNLVCDGMAAIEAAKPLWKLSFEDYLRWIEYQRQLGSTEGCISKYISHLRGLLNYAWRMGRADCNVLEGFTLMDRLPRKAPNVLNIEQAHVLIKGCPKGTYLERKDRMVILLLYGCGLRTNELCLLNVQDIDRERKELLVNGKGDKQRIVPIPDAVHTELVAYLLDREGKKGSLFRTEAKHKRISSKDVCDIVQRAAVRSGLDVRITPRTLRHTYATHLMDRGVNLAVISSLMGHRSPSETGVYLHALAGRDREAVNKLDNKKGGEQR